MTNSNRGTARHRAKPYTPTKEQQASAQAQRTRAASTASSSDDATYRKVFGVESASHGPQRAPQVEPLGALDPTAHAAADDSTGDELSEAAYRKLFHD